MDISKDNFVEVAHLVVNDEMEDTITQDLLVDILVIASDVFHNLEDSDVEGISDSVYDSLELMLKAMNPNHPFLAQIGSDVRGGKIDLPVTMGSLDQVYSGDTIQWVRDNNWLDKDFVISDKQDGTSALSVYGKGGYFARAYSRGNGFQGADISRHVKPMNCFVEKTTEPCMIREEVIIPDNVFEKWQKECEALGQRVYKNPRNFVAGRMNASESPQWFYDNVHVIATSVVEPKMGKREQFEFLEKNGFEVTPWIVVKGRDLTDEFLTEYLNKRRKESKTAIDGIVIDLDDAAIRSSLRRKSSSINPMYSKKFKLGSEENIAFPVCTGVSYEPSKHGYLKPRVHVEPTVLGGVTISNLTGFNAKFIRDNGIGVGAVLQITRSGDVIPYIQCVKTPVSPLLPKEEDFGPMHWSENQVDMILDSISSHRDVIVNVLCDIFGGSGLEVPHLRQGSVEKIVNAGYTQPEDIIKLSETELKSIVGDSAGSKIYHGIREKLNPVPLFILAGASGKFGRGMGRRKIVKITEHYGEEKFLSGTLTLSDIMKVDGFAQTTAQLFVDNFKSFMAFLDAIQGFFKLEYVEKVSGGLLDGVNFMFTGYRDKEAEAIIVAKGGTIQSSVNKDTTYLVTKDPNSTSSKANKARALGVKIIDPTEFKRIIGN